MWRSRLEVYLDILKILARHGRPLKLTHIMYKTGVNYGNVKQCLEFLVKQNLVEATLVWKRNIYHITERGIAVLETLNKLENTLKISCTHGFLSTTT